MKLRKFIVGFAIIALLTFSAYAVLASTGEYENNDYPAEYNYLNEVAPLGYFSSFTGIVKEINDFEGEEQSKFVLVENAEGQVANLVVSEGTFFINDNEITVGAEVTGYFRSNAPAIMIYPPQYNVSVVAVDLDESTLIKVDRFDENLLSQDQSLLLNITDDTKIVTQGGQALEEADLANRKLIVFYDVATRSMPAITIPNKIVVMYEIAEHPIATIDEEEYLPEVPIDVSSWYIIVEGQIITGNGFTNEEGAVMVPLRVIAEALGFEITWEWSAAERKVMLDGEITLRIGETTYYNQSVAIELPFAPELVGGTTTYVPLQFFRIVAGMNNAYAFEGQIVINNDEPMDQEVDNDEEEEYTEVDDNEEITE